MHEIMKTVTIITTTIVILFFVCLGFFCIRVDFLFCEKERTRFVAFIISHSYFILIQITVSTEYFSKDGNIVTIKRIIPFSSIVSY